MFVVYVCVFTTAYVWKSKNNRVRSESISSILHEFQGSNSGCQNLVVSTFTFWGIFLPCFSISYVTYSVLHYKQWQINKIKGKKYTRNIFIISFSKQVYSKYFKSNMLEKDELKIAFIAQWLRTLSALPKDLTSIPRIHMAVQNSL